MVDTVISFDTIWVIESLPVGDLQTGTSLFSEILGPAKSVHPTLSFRLTTPQSPSELLSVLDDIRLQAEGGAKPKIHFECHGSPDGLQCANGAFVAWQQLRSLLISINEACGLHLIVVLAACNGALNRPGFSGGCFH